MLDDDKMKSYVAGIFRVAEVGVWLAASCLEAIVDEALAGKVVSV